MTARTTAVGLLLLAACGGGGSDAPPGGGTVAPETLAAYCDQLWTGYAARWAACDRGSAAYYSAHFDPALRCADAVQAVAAGRATYQRTPAGACLDFVASATCDALEAQLDGRSPAPDCLAAVAGKLAPGATCYSDESCASDACGGALATCPSTCGPRHALGESCSDGYPCVTGLHCENRVAATLYTCQPLGGQGVLCQADGDCQLGLRCDHGTPGVSCQPRKTSGTCANDTYCRIDYACMNGSCVLPKGPGESCAQGQNQCGEGLWCSGGGCVDGPVATQSCASVNGELRPCTGSSCTADVCVAWTEGSSCSASVQCAPTMGCNNNQCVPPCPES